MSSSRNPASRAGPVEFVPDRFIAGRVPWRFESIGAGEEKKSSWAWLTGGGTSGKPKDLDPVEVAWNQAAANYDSEQVFLCLSVQDNDVFYIAGPSPEFASVPNPGTALANALPGRPLYRGRGLYVVKTRIGMAALEIEEGDEISAKQGDQQRFRAYARAQGMEIFDLSDEEPMPWMQFRRRAQERASDLMKQIASVSTVVLVTGVVAFTLASLWRSEIRAKRADTQALYEEGAAHAITVLRQADLVAGSADFKKVLKIIDDIQRLGGELVRYEVDAKGHHFIAEMPIYADLTKLRALGPITQSVPSTRENFVTLKVEGIAK